MKFSEIVIYIALALVLGILAAFATRNILIGIGLPIGIIVGILFLETLKGIAASQDDEKADKPAESKPAK